MAEHDYVVRLQSKRVDFTVGHMREILALPTLRRVLFPAGLPVAPAKMLTIENPQDFHVGLLPAEFQMEEEVMIPLYSKSNIRFEATVRQNFEDICRFGHVFLLQFHREHVSRGEIDVKMLKQYIAELAPLVRAVRISVFQNYEEPIPQPDGSFIFRPPRTLCGVPLELEWFTWYSPWDLAILGRERFEILRTCYEKYEFMGGVMIILHEEPFDKRNPEHLRRKRQAERELGFDRLPMDPK